MLCWRCQGKFTELYADDMVLLEPAVTALQTLLEVCRADAGPYDIVFNTTKTVCMLVRPTQHESGSEMRNLALSRSFVTQLGHVIAVDCGDDKDIGKQFRRQNAVGNMLVRKFSLAPILAKLQFFKSYCYLISECALWRHSYQNSIRILTVSYRDTFKRLINVTRCTSSSLAFAMNATDHINVVLRKSAYSLMSRVPTSSNSIVTVIVNSDAYHQSALVNKWESMLYV